MHDELSLFQRCLSTIAQLNDEHQWGLHTEQRLAYARHIAVCLASKADSTDIVLRMTALNYHADHAIVEALGDAEHPDHMNQWAEWTRSSTRILLSRSGSDTLLNEVAVSLEDLTQEAMIDLLKGLPAFSYQSRFHTWAYTVISNCLVRHHRSTHAMKRAAALGSQSLEKMIEVGQMPQDHAVVAPEEEVLGRELSELIRQVLAEHPDPRLATVFGIWTEEEQTLRAIGARLNLSATRVHALLTQALALLQSELRSQQWREQDAYAMQSLAG
jgi:RNA polymerase sigma factor (sigma-70 family)